MTGGDTRHYTNEERVRGKEGQDEGCYSTATRRAVLARACVRACVRTLAALETLVFAAVDIKPTFDIKRLDVCTTNLTLVYVRKFLKVEFHAVMTSRRTRGWLFRHETDDSGHCDCSEIKTNPGRNTPLSPLSPPSVRDVRGSS